MILYVAYSDNSSSGGSVRVLETLLIKLKDNNIDFNVIFIYNNPGIIFAQHPKKCFYLNATNRKGYKSFINFYRIYIKLKPSIVHLIDPIYWLQILLFFLKTKSVLHVHGAYWNKKLKYKLSFFWLISKVCINRFIAITHGTKDQLIKTFSVNSASIDIVYNSIDINKLNNNNSSSIINIKAKYNIPEHSKIIGSVGRIVQARGFEDLIKLLIHLDDNWHALIIGDGDYKIELLKLAKSLNLSNRVHFTGFVNNVTPFYEIMDIYGFFARYESFGLALADAMLLKKPIFGLKGAGEYHDLRNPLITNNNSTFIERPDFLNQWREELDSTIIDLSILIKDYDNNPKIYIEKKEIAYKHVLKYFNSDLQFFNLMKVYNKLNNE